jgi:ribosomal protein S18 acetylase RimI-like enzyme
MIRKSLPSDTPTLLDLAERTGVFKPYEIEALQEVLDDWHEVNHEYDHVAVTLTDNAGVILGFAYYAPTAMTDRTWEMWWIVVDPARHGQGLGRQLLEYTEAAVRNANGRILLIETSSTPAYIPTRGFYLKAGYNIAAEIADFYSDGDGKVIYSKRMSLEKN